MRTITPRISDELHAALKEAAWKNRTSLNKFIAKVLRRAVDVQDALREMVTIEQKCEEWESQTL